MSAKEAKEARLDAARAALDDEAKNKPAPRIDPGFDVGQELCLKEMREAEAKGDLPPATVHTPESMDKWDRYINRPMETEVIQSKEGGETPTEALETYDKEIDAEYDKVEGLHNRYSQLMKKIIPAGDGDFPKPETNLGEYRRMLDLVAKGIITLNDPDLQKEAVELVSSIKKAYRSPDTPEGYIPFVFSNRTGVVDELREKSRPLQEAVDKGELK